MPDFYVCRVQVRTDEQDRPYTCWLPAPNAVTASDPQAAVRSLRAVQGTVIAIPVDQVSRFTATLPAVPNVQPSTDPIIAVTT